MTAQQPSDNTEQKSSHKADKIALVIFIVFNTLVISGGVIGYSIIINKNKETIPPLTILPEQPLPETPIPEPPPVEQLKNKKITSCDSIVESGNYTLDEDLKPTGWGCLDIKDLRSVHIDCAGHSIILDQENKEPTGKYRPLLRFRNIENFSIKSCNLKVINPSQAPATIIIEDSTNGIISDNTFYDPNVTSNGLDLFYITLTRTSNVTFRNNTLYGVYQQHYSHNTLVENNVFSPSLKTLRQLQVDIAMNNGSHNTVRNNIIDGKWDGTTETRDIGADDGIEFSNESFDTIENNIIKNNWDCGIETDGLIEDTVISGNTIINSGICGIGAWYHNSWKRNTVADNIIDSSPRMFYFFRYYGLLPEEDAVYFTENIFRGNSFLNPTKTISAIFTFTDNTVTPMPYVTSNNLFTNNNFNPGVTAPRFNPVSMVVDGGGNICGGAIPGQAAGQYPNPADFPLKCGSQ